MAIVSRRLAPSLAHSLTHSRSGGDRARPAGNGPELGEEPVAGFRPSLPSSSRRAARLRRTLETVASRETLFPLLPCPRRARLERILLLAGSRWLSHGQCPAARRSSAPRPRAGAAAPGAAHAPLGGTTSMTRRESTGGGGEPLGWERSSVAIVLSLASFRTRVRCRVAAVPTRSRLCTKVFPFFSLPARIRDASPAARRGSHRGMRVVRLGRTLRQPRARPHTPCRRRGVRAAIR